MKKHIDWKRVGWVTGIIAYFISFLLLIYFHFAQNLTESQINYGDIGRWAVSVALTLLSPFFLLMIVCLILSAPNFFYHNGEEKKE